MATASACLAYTFQVILIDVMILSQCLHRSYILDQQKSIMQINFNPYLRFGCWLPLSISYFQLFLSAFPEPLKLYLKSTLIG